MALFAWRRGRNIVDVFDFAAPLPGIGLFFGRIGNFINGELWGKATDGALGLQGQRRGAPRLAALRGGARRPAAVRRAVVVHAQAAAALGALGPVPAAATALSRFLVEFVRVPDEQIGYLAGGWLTMGSCCRCR